MQKGFLEAQQAVILSIKSPSLVLLNVLFQSVINCYKKKFSAWVIVKFSFFKKLLRAFTVIRSPFVYKSSREQLCIVTYQAKLFLQMENFYIADYLEFFLVKVLFLKLSSVKHVIIRKLSNNFIYY
jgi:ribosomal protein S10